MVNANKTPVTVGMFGMFEYAEYVNHLRDWMVCLVWVIFNVLINYKLFLFVPM